LGILVAYHIIDFLSQEITGKSVSQNILEAFDADATLLNGN